MHDARDHPSGHASALTMPRARLGRLRHPGAGLCPAFLAVETSHNGRKSGVSINGRARLNPG
jgi:hypothetical protein